MSEFGIKSSAVVQFADFDGSDNMIWEVPLVRIPTRGENLNIRHDHMVYFLEVEGITNFVDCGGEFGEEHSITIDAKLLRCSPTHLAEATND